MTAFNSLIAQTDNLEVAETTPNQHVLNVSSPNGRQKIIGSGTVFSRGNDGRYVLHNVSNSIQKDSSTVKRLIVEFYGEPLLRYNKKPFAIKATQSIHEKTFISFENDLNAIAGKLSTLRTATSGSPIINRNFKNAFFGSSIYAKEAMIDEIKKLPYVKSVRLATEVKAFLDISVPITGAPNIWTDYNDQGEGIVIVIIDTGIDYNHPALGGGIGPGFKVLGGYDFVNKDDDPMDDQGHGTHVAGIVSADGVTIKGVAPKASLLAYKVLDNNGSGWDDDIIAAIEQCIDPNNDGNFDDMADIVNMSLGGGGSYDDPMSVAVNNASEAGVVFCIAAGNSGKKSYTIGSPGNAMNAITVGASDDNDNLANFSSRGPNAGNFSIKPEIIAPGVDIYSLAPNNDYVVHSGTSMATPHVAGVCALLKKIHPNWGFKEMKSALATTAKDLGLSPFEQGGGRVQAEKAVKVNIIADPPLLSYNRLPFGVGLFEKTDTITISNVSGTQQTYYFSVDSADDAFILVPEVDSVTLEAGSSARVGFSLTVSENLINDNDSLTDQFYGKVRLFSVNDTITIPWGIARTCMFTLLCDTTFTYYIYNKENLIYDDLINEEDQLKSYSVPIRPGNYKLLFNSEMNFLKYNVNINGDDTLLVDFSKAKNKVVINPVDDNYKSMNSKGAKTNIFFKDEFVLSIFSGYSYGGYINTSEIAKEDTLGFYGVFYNGNENNVYVPFDCKSGIISDTTLQNDPSDYYKKDIVVRYPNCTNLVFAEYIGGYTTWGMDSKHFSLKDKTLKTTLFLQRSEEPLIISAAYAINPETESDMHSEEFLSNPFRIKNDTLINFYFENFSDLDADRRYKTDYYSIDKYYSPPGQPFIINSGPELFKPSYLFDLDNDPESGIKGNMFVSYSRNKHLGEEIFIDEYSANLTITDSTDNIIYQGNPEYIDTTLVPGIYTCISNSEQKIYNNLKTNLQITNRFDLRKVAYPPVINSFFIKDTNNIPGNIFTNNISIYFTISDETPYVKVFTDSIYGEFKFLANKFNHMEPDSIHLFHKNYNSTGWSELSTILVGVDSLTGYNFSAILPEFNNTESSTYDVKITSKDRDGNYSEYIFTNCFLVRDANKPLANDDFYECVGSKLFTVNKETGLLVNDIAKDSYFGIHTFILSTTENGTTKLASDGSFSYRPENGFIGEDTFMYYSENFEGLSDTATVVINVLEPPVSIINEEAVPGIIFTAFPNPVVTSSYIEFNLEKESMVQLSVYNIKGDLIEQLYSGLLPTGDHSFIWDVSGNSGAIVADGVYFFRLTSETGTITKKVIVMKE